MSDAINDFRAFLAEEGADLTQEQVRALDEFIDQLGGIENAALAIKLLEEQPADSYQQRRRREDAIEHEDAEGHRLLRRLVRRGGLPGSDAPAGGRGSRRFPGPGS